MNRIFIDTSTSSRLRPLDTLRGVAAIAVAFFWHYRHFNFQLFESNPSAMPLYYIFKWFYHYGWNLVEFFFVLSGFIFMHVYSKKIVDNEIDNRSFFILRLSRLYPLHILTLFAVAFLQYYRMLTGNGFFQSDINDLYHLVLNLFFIQAGLFEDGLSFNGPSWSISCEMLAYILFFYVLKKVKRPVPVFLFFIFIGMSIMQKQINLPLFNALTGKMYIGFFIGCLTYLLNNGISSLGRKQKSMLFGGILIFFTVLTLLLVKIGFMRVFGHWERVMPLLIYPLVIIVALNIHYLNWFLSLRPFTYFGDLSYSIYLLHFPVQLIMVTLLPMIGLAPDYTSWKGLAAFAALTLFSAVISYHLFEQPIQNLIRKRMIKER